MNNVAPVSAHRVIGVIVLNKYAVSYLRLELSIEFLMSFRESVNDLNSNEFRSPPSAKHCSGKQNPKAKESALTNSARVQM